jgi:hypothetical protein
MAKILSPWFLDMKPDEDGCKMIANVTIVNSKEVIEELGWLCGTAAQYDDCREIWMAAMGEIFRIVSGKMAGAKAVIVQKQT